MDHRENTQTAVSPRRQAASVERYLNALDAAAGFRRVDPDDLQDAIDLLDEQIEGTSDLERLGLVQKRIDVQEQLTEITEREARLEELEDEFVEVAADWAAASGITYQALQCAGVPRAVLDRTGIPQHRRGHPKTR